MNYYQGHEFTKEEKEKALLLKNKLIKFEAKVRGKCHIKDLLMDPYHPEWHIEYFDDLGLEYNVDYKDTAKGDSVIESKSIKEEPVPEVEEKELESTLELEITKEQMRPKTAKEIKKVTKITDSDIEEPEEETNEPDEKNLYDLIDMMYESKE